jgi:hypothetical protein
MSYVTPSNDFVEVRPEIQTSRILSQPQVTEHEIKSMEEQQRRLNYFTDTTNQELAQQQEHEVFINLSLVNLLSKMSSTIIVIINELLSITKDTQFNDILLIFVKEDRLVYIGMLFVMISLAIYLIDITS